VSLVEELAALHASGARGVLFTVIEGSDAGAKILVPEEGAPSGADLPDVIVHASEIQRAGRNRLLEIGGSKVFAEVYGPPPRLLVIGAVDTAESLCRGAKLLGWTALVADARPVFLTRERIPSADRLIAKWPDDALAEVAPDHQTAVVVLTHDDKFDIPALVGALATDAFYVGALGSRRNQERRRERLRDAGVDEASVDRIHGPCGLDIGADSQAETALSILSEILAVRAGRSGGQLRVARERIHAGG
jgi:xanthine dehydrogenase accessory factor